MKEGRRKFISQLGLGKRVQRLDLPDMIYTPIPIVPAPERKMIPNRTKREMQENRVLKCYPEKRT